MIVPMQHVTVLCLESEREETLARLAELGVLHLEETPGLRDKPRVKQALRKHARIQHVLDYLAELPRDDPPAAPSSEPPDLATVLDAFRNLEELQKEEAQLDNLLAQWTPFGDFDPALIGALEESGIPVQLVRIEKFGKEAPELPQTMTFQPLAEDKRSIWGALIGEGDRPAPMRRVDIPEIPTAEIRHRRSAVHEEIKQLECFLLGAVPFLDALRREALRTEDLLELAKARERILREGPLVWLSGFCPGESLEPVQNAAADYGWGLQIRPPLPDESVPTLVKNPSWVRPIKSVFQILNIVPGYREADISPLFLVFFTLFFAMLIGDAGYGLLLLGVTQLIAMKRKDVPGYALVMLRLLGGATTAWGVITGNYFGIDPALLPAFMQPRGSLLWFQKTDNIMRLCFFIGALHLSMAHAWNFIALWPDRKALAQVGWLVILWCMYATACGMVLQDPYPAWLPYGFMAGMGLVVLFMTPASEFKERWIDHAMLPLSLISAMVDVISYIRLFAVGVATLQVAESFNNMALNLQMPLLVRIPIALVILLLGHGLNIVLGGLSILVHGVRLNTLEFSQHKGLEWSGFPYSPLRKKAQTDY